MLGYPKPSAGARLYLYLRVSSARQAAEDKYGPEVQQRTCDAFRQVFGVYMPPAVSGTFRDVISTKDGGAGAKFRNRPAGREMFATLSRGDYVLCATISRLGRTQAEATQTVLDLHAIGVTIWFAEQALCSATPMGRAIIDLFSAMAQMDNENRALMRRETISLKRAAGICTDLIYLPPGYRFSNPERTRFEPDEDEHALMEFIYQARDMGLGPKAISAILRSERIVRADGGGRGHKFQQIYWTRARVESALKIMQGRRGPLERSPCNGDRTEAKRWFRDEVRRRFRCLKKAPSTVSAIDAAGCEAPSVATVQIPIVEVQSFP